MSKNQRVKELDEARAKEAWRIYMFHHNEPPKGEDEHRVPAEIAARLARENWTPPEPADPDILAFREWFADRNDPVDRAHILAGHWDSNFVATYFLAGARIAREQERERAKALVDYVWSDVGDQVGADGGARSNRAFDTITKYEEGGR